ncbi:MAG: hypothetical protein ACI8YC_000680, partial [Salibacteraceae bacterium]
TFSFLFLFRLILNNEANVLSEFNLHNTYR